MIYTIVERQECKSIWKARWFLSVQLSFRRAARPTFSRNIVAQYFPRVCREARFFYSTTSGNLHDGKAWLAGWAAPVLPNEPTNCFEPRADLPWETWNDPWMCTREWAVSRSAIIIISRRFVFFFNWSRIRIPLCISFRSRKKEIQSKFYLVIENKKLISPI